jgi:hypothetical protein
MAHKGGVGGGLQIFGMYTIKQTNQQIPHILLTMILIFIDTFVYNLLLYVRYSGEGQNDPSYA